MHKQKGVLILGRHGENIRKRKDGRWEARYIMGYDEHGKAQYKYLYGKTYYEVRDLKNRMMSEKATRKSLDNTSNMKITFGQLLDDWLLSIRQDVKESTYSRYVFLIRKHILPELGNLFLINMTSETIDRFTCKKLNEGKLNAKGGLSPKTVSGLLSIIKLALDFGKERKYYCPDSIIIKNPRQNRPEIMVLSLQEQQQLERYLFAGQEPVHTGILLSLYAGLRIGEVCALKWGDFSFMNNTVTICRTIMRIQDVSPDAVHKTKIVIGQPKTECSNRTIPLPAFLVRYLRRIGDSKNCYVLTGSEEYMEPRTYYIKYKKIMEICHLEQFNYHALRHTFATRCIENDFDLKSLSEILGHANVTTTMQRYVHPSMNLKRQHMDKLEHISVCGQDFSQDEQQNTQNPVNHCD